MTITSDNGPQFRSDEFGEYCTHYDAIHAIQHLRVTAKWAQANGEVERQNASVVERVRITQAAGLNNWKKELRMYVAKYRGLPHSTTVKSPVELTITESLEEHFLISRWSIVMNCTCGIKTQN